MSTDPIKAAIPLWYAQMAWAKELIMRSFGLQRAEDILSRELRGVRAVPGTVWFVRTHGIGVDIFKTPDVCVVSTLISINLTPTHGVCSYSSSAK